MSATAPRRRGAVTARVAQARGLRRTGATPMELAAASYGHLRGDLTRIAILSVVMIGVIVILSFVIR